MRRLGLLLLMLVAVCSCREEAPVGVILDTDIGNDIDDVECLDILCKYVDAGKVDLLSVMLNKEGAAVAEAADIYMTWYGYPDIPVGIVRDSPTGPMEEQYIHSVLDAVDTDGAPAFARSGGDYANLPDACVLYRKILSSRPDNSVTIVSVGFSTNLARLLSSPPDRYSPLSGRDLIKAKVKRLVMMAGRFTSDGASEFNVLKDILSARELFDCWPTEVVVSPWELGNDTRYPVERLEHDFSWTKYHPFVISYKDYQSMPYRNCMFDPTAVIYALEGTWDGLMNISESGKITVDDAGRTVFEPDSRGLHRILSAEARQRDSLASRLADILAERPLAHRISAPQGTEKIIFETDMGNDVDDALALDMLHKYADQGNADILAVTLNKESVQAPEYVDLFNTWYGRPDVPVGIIRNGPECAQGDYCARVCDMRDSLGNPRFQRSLSGYDSLMDAHLLQRKILAAQPDRSVTIVSVGFSTNLARLLSSPPDRYSPLSGRDLIEAKVKALVLTGGMFVPEDKPEYNVRTDVAAARAVFDGWPAPVIVSPGEVGSRVQYPSSCIENDFRWSDAHPVVESYRAFKPMPYDRNCWDLMAVLYAVEGECGDYFNLSPRGRIGVTDEGFTSFEYDPSGRVRYLQVQDEQIARIKSRFLELTTLKPKIYE